MRRLAFPRSVPLRAALLGTAALIGLSASPALAICPSIWVVPTGDWSSGGSWGICGVPDATRDAVISNGGTAQVTSADAAKTVTIDTASTLEMKTGGSLDVNTAGSFLVGGASAGTLLLNGSAAITVGGSATGAIDLGNLGLIRAAQSATLTNPINFAAGSSTEIDAASGQVLTLAGANTRLGGFTLTIGGGGTVVFAKTGTTGPDSSTINAGTTLQFGNHSGVGNDGFFSAPVTDNGVLAVDFSAGDFLNFSSVISGTGSVSEIGQGYLGLNAANTYSGGTLVTSNAVIINVATVGTPGAITSSAIGTGTLTLNGGAVRAGGAFTVANAVSLGASGGTIDINGNNFTFSGVISGTGLSITNSGAGGSLILTGANTYTGVTGTNAGTALILSGSGSIAASSQLIMTTGTSLDISGITASGTTVQSLITGGSTFNLGSKKLTFTSGSSSGAVAFNDGGFFGGTGGSVAYAGANFDLTTSGASSYSGGTSISNGSVVTVNADNQLGSVGSALSLGNASTAGTIKTSGSFALTHAVSIGGAGGGTLDVNSGTLTIVNPITGTGPVTFKSTTPGGIIGLGAVATYTGATTINSGTTLVIAGSGALPTTSAITHNGAMTVAADTSFASLAGSGSIAIGSKILTLNGNASTTFSGVISGVGGQLVKQGSGTLILSGSNSFNGPTTVSGGTLQLGNGATGNIGSTVINVASGATFAFNFNSGFANIGGVTGAGNFLQMGTAFTTVFSALTYTGTTTISGGTFFAGSANRFAPSSATTVASGATLDMGSTNQTIGSLAGAGIVTSTGDVTPSTLTVGGDNSSTTFSGVIKNGSALSVVSLVKTGTGNLTLSGANTYTGSTTVSGGTLSVNGTLASTLTIASGGTLGGTGTVGTSTIASGGTLAPGNSIGTLTVAGNLTLAAGSLYSVEVSPAAADQTIVTGTTTIAAGDTLTFVPSAGPYTGTTYTLIKSTGALTGTFTTVNFGAGFGGLTPSVLYDANDVFLKLVASTFIWGTAPGSTDWNTATNWQAGVVPTAINTAVFDTTTKPTVAVTAATAAAFSLQFNAGAPAYSLAVTGNSTAAASLTLSAGITDSSKNAPTVTVSGVSAANRGSLFFTGTGDAADANLVTGSFGVVDFSGTTGTSGNKLVNAGSVAGSGAFVLGANTLVTGSSNTSTEVSGVISGTGGLTKTGSGVLTLSGAQTYTGGTTISAGTLQLGAGGASGSIVGNITDNATLAFNRSDAFTYAGVISGSGSVQQVGSGSTTLTAAQTYTGTTIVNAGTLNVNSSLASTSITVNNGTLSVNGSLAAASTVTVNGGTLKGSGTLGAVTVMGGGTEAPGNSIGTMNVASVTFANQFSVYQAEVDNAGHSDLINASGKATINGGTVQAIEAAGTYQPVSTYVIINAAGGVTGTFNAVTSSLSNLNPSLVYTANTVSLRLLRNDLQFGSYGGTPNQIAAGGGVSALGAGNGLYFALANVANTPANVPAALDSLSGEIYVSQRSALIQDGRLIRNSVFDHLTASAADGINAWGTGFGDSGDIQGDGNAATLNHTDNGFIGGADMPLFDGLRAGAAFAFTGQSLSVPDRLSRATGKTKHVILYAAFRQDAWAVKFGEDYGWGDSTITRQVSFLPESNTANDGHHTSQIFGDAGYDLKADAITVTPHAGLAWTQAHTSSFAETGGALSALSGGGHSSSTVLSNLGIRAVTGPVALFDMQVMPRIDLGWQHDFEVLRPGQSLAFNGASFTVLGTPLATDAATAALGFDLKLASGGTLSFDYDGLFSGRVMDNAIKAGFNWKF